MHETNEFPPAPPATLKDIVGLMAGLKTLECDAFHDQANLDLLASVTLAHSQAITRMLSILEDLVARVQQLETRR